MSQQKGFNALFVSLDESLMSKVEIYLERQKLYPHFRNIKNEAGLTNALADTRWEIILYEFPTSSINIDIFVDQWTKNPTFIPVVLIGNNTDGEIVADLIKKGFSDYVEKENLERLKRVILREIERYNFLKSSARYNILKRNVDLSDICARFAGGIAHNISNVLMAILNNALFIKDNPDLTTNIKDDINRIITSVKKGEEFIKNLLSIASGHKLNLQILDVNSLIYKIAENIRGTMDTDVEINLQRSTETAKINVDENLVLQAFREIARNAKDAMKGTGIFKIKVEIVNLNEDDPILKFGKLKALEYVKFTLSDTGMGIPEEVRPHIFEPFFTTKGRDARLGLGLPISCGIIREHNGVIDFDSTVGEGSTFYIYLPLYKKDSKEIPLPKQSEFGRTRKGRVLIVEDDLDIRFVLNRILIEEGFNTMEAIDGLGAMVMLNKIKPTDLFAVITDVIMPKMNGLELAKNIREKYKDVKIIFISGYPDNNEEILNFKNSIFIQKPITKDTLMCKIKEFLIGKNDKEI